MSTFPTNFAPAPSPIDPAASSLVGPGGEVIADLPCRKCAYNLRGLPAAGRCPECGSAVGVSLQGNLLRFCDPGWVRTLQRGVRLMVYGVLTIVIGVVAVAIAGTGAAMRIQLRPLTQLIGVAGYGLILIGTWQLTEPDPSGIGEDEYGTARKLIRITLLIGAANFLLNLLQSSVSVSGEISIALSIIGFLAGISGLIGMFAQLRYIRKLSLRIPDPALADRAQFLTYALGGTYAAMLGLGVLVALLARGAAGMGAIGSLGCVWGVVLLLMLVFGIMYLLMLEKLGRSFGNEAAAAEQSWYRTSFDAATLAPAPLPPRAV